MAVRRIHSSLRGLESLLLVKPLVSLLGSPASEVQLGEVERGVAPAPGHSQHWAVTEDNALLTFTGAPDRVRGTVAPTKL